jgi:hypothetical protein
MMRTWKLAVLAVAMLAATVSRAKADPLIFDFSFTNTNGNVSGTVTGQILGLVNNESSQAATQILIDQYPAGLNGIGATPVNVTSWNLHISNLFDVSDGQVTGGFFEAESNQIAGSPFLALDINPPNPSVGVLSNHVETDQGNGTLDIVPSPTPEPASIALLVSGFLGFGGFGLYRRRRGTTERESASAAL